MHTRSCSNAGRFFAPNYRCSRLSLFVVLLLAATAHGAPPKSAANDNGLAIPPVENILATLQPAHPRVMAGSQTFDDLKALIRKGGLPAQIYSEVKKSADQLLSAPVSKYEKPDGRRLSRVSRRALREAIVSKGLREGLKVYESKKG